MLIGVATPLGHVHLADSSHAQPQGTIATYHEFHTHVHMHTKKYTRLYNIILAIHNTLPPHLALLPTFSLILITITLS